MDGGAGRQAQALRELGSTTREADKLRLRLKRSQIEEAQAQSERLAAAAALAELQAARVEVESLEKVRAAAAESRETGKAVEELAAELAALKAELESSRGAHVDAEEKRLRLPLALEQDKSQWQVELGDAQHEAKRLRAQLVATCDVEIKAEAASQAMASLLQVSSSSSPTMLELEKTRKELEDVRASVERARDEAECLRAAASVRDELDREKAALAALRRREGLSSASIPYLEEELRRATSELAAAEAAAAIVAASGCESKRMAEQQVGEALREAEEAKAKARSAREEIARAREEAGVARAAAATVEAQLEAVAREILTATTSEEVAAASGGALLQQLLHPAEEVTLTAAEYGELSRRARETEEVAGRRVMEAVKLIKEAKDAEVRTLERLARQDRRTEQRRQALEAEEAEFAKLTAERELRQWRADHDHGFSPRARLAEISVLHHRGAAGGDNPHILSPRGGYMQPRSTAELTAEAEARQGKTTFFPRMLMFLARKRAQSAWK